MNMTKEQRAERKELNRQLKNVRGNIGRAALATMKAKHKITKQHAKAVKAMERDLKRQQKALERELRLERAACEKEELAILNRLAIVEGRLVS